MALTVMQRLMRLGQLFCQAVEAIYRFSVNGGAKMYHLAGG